MKQFDGRDRADETDEPRCNDDPRRYMKRDPVTNVIFAVWIHGVNKGVSKSLRPNRAIWREGWDERSRLD